MTNDYNLGIDHSPSSTTTTPTPTQLEKSCTMQHNQSENFRSRSPRSPTSRPTLTRGISSSLMLPVSLDSLTSASSMASINDPLDTNNRNDILTNRRRSSIFFESSMMLPKFEQSNVSPRSSTSDSFSSASSVSSCDSDSSVASSHDPAVQREQHMVVEKLVALVVMEVQTETYSLSSNVTMETAIGVLCELAAEKRWKRARVHLTDPVAVAAFAQLLERASSPTVKAKAVSLLWMISSWCASRRREANFFVAALVGGCPDLVSHVAEVHTSEAIGLLRTIVSHHPNPAALETIIVATKLISITNKCLASNDARMQERTAGLVWILSMQSAVLARALAACAGHLVKALKGKTSKSLQENAAGALWSISNDVTTRVTLRHAGAIHALVEVAAHGSSLARDHAAGALLHLGRLR